MLARVFGDLSPASDDGRSAPTARQLLHPQKTEPAPFNILQAITIRLTPDAASHMPSLFRRTDSDSAAIIVWASVALTVLRLSLEASNRLILWQVYGRRAVVANHLWLVRAKPELVVSNGDVLRGFGPIHYFYGVALWIPATIAVLVLLVRYAAPRWWREASANPRKMKPGAIGVVATLLMFFTIPGLPLVQALTLGGLAAMAGLWWLRNSVP